MPSVSPAQKRTMAAVAHGWHPPASSGINIPVKVARDFNKADQAARTHATVKALRSK
jgi:hypothetical protein